MSVISIVTGVLLVSTSCGAIWREEPKPRTTTRRGKSGTSQRTDAKSGSTEIDATQHVRNAWSTVARSATDRVQEPNSARWRLRARDFVDLARRLNRLWCATFALRRDLRSGGFGCAQSYS